ncbi:MAG: helix-turn-helix transcriptional regulator [Bacteroidota bacterium]
MNPSIYTILLAVGAVQGIVLGFLLFSQSLNNKLANRILAVLLFLMSYRLLLEAGYAYGLGWVSNWSYQLLFEYHWLYGALIFFYIRAYFQQKINWSGNDLWHFVPITIELLFSNWVKIQNFYWDGTVESLSAFGNWSYQVWEHTPIQFLVAGLLILFYAKASTRLIRRLQTEEKIIVNDQGLRWINKILLVYQSFSILLIAFVLIDYFFFDYAFNSFFQFPVYVVMAILTYWLGLQAYLRRNEIVVKPTLPTDKLNQLETIARQIDDVMRSKQLYLNPNLSLSDLADELALKSYLITKTLNQVKGKKFSDYVNEWRVEEWKQLLQQGKYEHYSLLALAFEAGFNSKASFNRIIKKATGQSPSQFKSSTQIRN